jgi:hypothetical protein
MFCAARDSAGELLCVAIPLSKKRPEKSKTEQEGDAVAGIIDELMERRCWRRISELLRRPSFAPR